MEHNIKEVTVMRDLDGSDVRIWVHEFIGSEPGPTLGVIGTQHGDEWLTVSALRHTVEQLGKEEFRGKVIVIPVANPVSLRDGVRNTQIESDAPDMNRVWPGSFTWITDLLVKALVPFVESCDALIDLHFGQWGVLMANAWWSEDLPDDKVTQQGRDMCIAFGSSVQRRAGLKHPGSGTLAAYAGIGLGIPCISGGIGGAGFGLAEEQRWIEANTTGVLNVMTQLGMRTEPMKLPDQLLHFSKTTRVHPSVGGLLLPEPEVIDLLPRVEPGQKLGVVVCPQTFEVLETLTAPVGGWLYWTARSYPVRPGCFAFGLAEESSAQWLPSPTTS
ncbi:succinylglutamate desuccinylase/aspartoacylase family protein [Streptosporangium sp. NBC_01755]|uniref:succinylglutamate desuccinylase/aspartoacylase family protein n=1 Tax=unclassified Streptosporangium TaxID=2632669 RepID=UPI002DDBA765|nr:MULTISPECIES: succinylglutamate desuccinylase/aspartoacylase family protein [unclassified Streptosporangium]WSA28775.1 succinylglutamate desuccinylase/aspartoacylase family protein [Streptosporangium sp. NBC_01810]WSC99772.1 succinylglutamate desuccinylase/aspartoacylase family protein [Streptosporangium sp. NBC_01755]